jgi:siderophore synthetase component
VRGDALGLADGGADRLPCAVAVTVAAIVATTTVAPAAAAAAISATVATAAAIAAAATAAVTAAAPAAAHKLFQASQQGVCSHPGARLHRGVCDCGQQAQEAELAPRVHLRQQAHDGCRVVFHN